MGRQTLPSSTTYTLNYESCAPRGATSLDNCGFLLTPTGFRTGLRSDASSSDDSNSDDPYPLSQCSHATNDPSMAAVVTTC